MVDPKNVATGRNNKANGAAFELRVRKDLEEKGWIVSKWPNNIIDGKLCAAKHKWNGPGRPMALGTGFPDFIAFRKNYTPNKNQEGIYVWMYEVLGVEAKSNGTLTKLEKEKCQWLLENQIFSKILIAKKTKPKNKIVVEYNNFEVEE